MAVIVQRFEFNGGPVIFKAASFKFKLNTK